MNQGDHHAEATFKLVNEAYAILSDEKERQTYNTHHRFAGLHHNISSASPRFYSNPHYDPANNAASQQYREYMRNTQMNNNTTTNNSNNNPFGNDNFSSSNGSRNNSNGRPFNMNDFIDYNEWYRMQYGMDEKQQEAYMNEKLNQGKNQGFANFNDPNATPHQNYEARKAARFAAAAQQRAERGYSETHRYRQWAHTYRANVVAAERAWPLTLIGWGMVFGGFYLFAQKMWANHR